MLSTRPRMTFLAPLLLVAFSGTCLGGSCPDDPEIDLCDHDLVSSGSLRIASGSLPLTLVLALTLRGKDAQHLALVPLLGLLPSLIPTAEAATCGDIKTFYKNQDCCGSAEQALTAIPPGCPYSFVKPSCDTAEPQAPRDLSTGATGEKIPKAATLNHAQATALPLVNVHFHLGAEHRSDDYGNGTDSEAYDHAHGSSRRLASNPRPGWMCNVSDLTEADLAPYDFKYCKGDVQVGKSYEVHYVHSSAGYSPEEIEGASYDLGDGLGGAANGRGLLNPMVVVEGQVYQLVSSAPKGKNLLYGWTVEEHDNAVMYPGSTTGPSHNNQVCSPYSITWHVDKKCFQTHPEDFDNMCKRMKEVYKMDSDLYPHGSRILLDPKYVVKPEYVQKLA